MKTVVQFSDNKATFMNVIKCCKFNSVECIDEIWFRQVPNIDLCFEAFCLYTQAMESDRTLKPRSYYDLFIVRRERVFDLVAMKYGQSIKNYPHLPND